MLTYYPGCDFVSRYGAQLCAFATYRSVQRGHGKREDGEERRKSGGGGGLVQYDVYTMETQYSVFKAGERKSSHLKPHVSQVYYFPQTGKHL